MSIYDKHDNVQLTAITEKFLQFLVILSVIYREWLITSYHLGLVDILPVPNIL